MMGHVVSCAKIWWRVESLSCIIAVGHEIMSMHAIKGSNHDSFIIILYSATSMPNILKCWRIDCSLDILRNVREGLLNQKIRIGEPFDIHKILTEDRVVM